MMGRRVRIIARLAKLTTTGTGCSSLRSFQGEGIEGERGYEDGPEPLPRGSKYPRFKVFGPKNHTLNGIWDQSP